MEQKNSTVVLIRPHACTEKAIERVRWALFDRGYAIMNEGEITADVLEQRMAFERQYCGAVARAKAEAPGDLPGRDVIAFRKVFNLHWKTTIERDIIVGAWAAMERLGIGAQELATRWQAAYDAGKMVCFGSSFAVGLVDGLYVVNGYLPAVREEMYAPGAKLFYWELEFNFYRQFGWAEYMQNDLGDEDPTKANEDSVRAILHNEWEELGLAQQPTWTMNAVFGSRGPFEAYFHKSIYLPNHDPFKDYFYTAMLACGISRPTIERLGADPYLKWGPAGFIRKQYTYDALAGVNAEDALNRIMCIVPPVQLKLSFKIALVAFLVGVAFAKLFV